MDGLFSAVSQMEANVESGGGAHYNGSDELRRVQEESREFANRTAWSERSDYLDEDDFQEFLDSGFSPSTAMAAMYMGY